MSRAVVVVAAGSGTRLGIGDAKAFVPVAGELMLTRAIRTVFTLAEPTVVVVVAPAGRLDECRALVAAVAGPAVDLTAVVPGGADRHASVLAGLDAVPAGVEWVGVHDAARCLTPAAQFEAVFAAARSAGAGAVPALPVTDTVKRVEDGVVVETVDRSALVGVQTPQVFPVGALRDAYARSQQSETDDAGVFQAAGGTVHTVPGDADAFKITTRWDLARAEAIVATRTDAGAAAAPDTTSVRRPSGSGSASTSMRSTRPPRAASASSTSRARPDSPGTATATRSRTRSATPCSRPVGSATSAAASARRTRRSRVPRATSSCEARSRSSPRPGSYRPASRCR